MAKFMAFYMAPLAAIDQMMKMPPEAAKDAMAAWSTWFDAHKKDVAEMGAPLGKTKTVSGRSVADSRNEMTGYTIVEARLPRRRREDVRRPPAPGDARARRSRWSKSPRSPACSPPTFALWAKHRPLTAPSPEGKEGHRTLAKRSVSL